MASRIQPGAQVAWLRERDEQERVAWIALFRNSTLPLGKVIQQLFDKRDALWQVDTDGPKALKDPRPAQPPPVPERARGESRQEGGGEPRQRGGAKTFAKKLKDGSWICAPFQTGHCSTTGVCPKGKHVCAVTLRNDRVCGGRHAGGKCQNRKAKLR